MRHVSVHALVTALLLPLLGGAALAQTPVRSYLPDAADEDWSFLKDAPRTDPWDRVKYIPLGREDWFITLSGEVRYRPEGFRVRGTESRPGTIDNYLLQRYLLGANVRLGTRARFFAELQSGIVNGKLRSPRPSDRNSLDLHQAFVELRPSGREDRMLTVKVGRQALAIGSTRLISASPGLNVKRSFDGVETTFRTRSWTVAGAAARLVALRSGLFDDRTDSSQLFWGIAAGRRSPRFERGELGVYYLGIDRKLSLYAQGGGPERRHTIGLKWTGDGTRLNLNYDALAQWGELSGSSIRAWAFATETGLRLASTGWRPRLSVRADVASGDEDRADPRLQAFNPLFPGNSYSGAVGLLGPTNLTDLTPALRVTPWPTLVVAFEAPSYWRTSTGDGVYGTDLRPLIRPEAGDGRYVGTNPGIVVVWQATRHLQMQGAVTRFLAGGFLENTFVSTGFGFYSASAVYRF
jgi:Alginate export